MKKQKISIQELVQNIREILTYILMIAIYVLIWRFTYKLASDDITFWGTIICFAMGWAIMSWYEEENCLYSMKKFHKFLGALVGIPLVLGALVNKLIDCLLKENEPQKETKAENIAQQSAKPKTANEILKEVNEIEKKYNNMSSYNNYNLNTKEEYEEEHEEEYEEEYECERCFRKISEEEFELFDGMCEECFDETHYDFDEL